MSRFRFTFEVFLIDFEGVKLIMTREAFEFRLIKFPFRLGL
jgi:hypothetical protein